MLQHKYIIIWIQICKYIYNIHYNDNTLSFKLHIIQIRSNWHQMSTHQIYMFNFNSLFPSFFLSFKGAHILHLWFQRSSGQGRWVACRSLPRCSSLQTRLSRSSPPARGSGHCQRKSHCRTQCPCCPGPRLWSCWMRPHRRYLWRRPSEDRGWMVEGAYLWMENRGGIQM